MPFAGVTDDVLTFELKTIEGGYVKLRRLTYGEKLRRTETAAETAMKGDGKKNTEMIMKVLAYNTALIEFAACIVEHNLEYLDAHGNLTPFNFKNADWPSRLDPQVGEEIDSYISQINNFGEDVIGAKN